MSFVINPGTVTPPLTAGGIAYGTGSQVKVNNAGTLGQLLQSNGALVPTWVTVSQSTGTVTSVAQTFTGGIVTVTGSPITTSGTLALTVAGTSGGIPYFGSSSTWASSAVLTQYGIVYGGGAGASPVATAAGTTGQVLTATTSAAPTWQTPAVQGFSTMQVFTSSGTFTVPAGVTKCKVTVTGGGGGNNGTAGAGGAGGTAIGYVNLSGGTASITVGNGSSGTGGASSFVYGVTNFTGNGGAGGGNNTFAQGGSASGGTLNITGGGGNYVNTPSGCGGASIYGGAAVGQSNYGAGGLIYSSGGTTQVASSGSNGVVVIEF